MDEPLSGVVADVPTPRNTDGSINLDIIQVIVDRTIHAGVNAILVAGKVGDAETSPSRFIPCEDEHSICFSENKYTFYSSEDVQIVKAYLEAAKGKIRIIAGIPDLPLDYIDEWRQGYRDLGCYAVIFMGGKTVLKLYDMDEGIECTHTPLMYCLCNSYTFDDVAYGNNSPLDEQYFTNFMTMAHLEGENRFNGKDSLCFSALSLGAPGIITGIAAILPHHCVQFYRILRIERDLGKARLQWDFLGELANYLGRGNYAANVKAAMRLIGIDTELNKDVNDVIYRNVDFGLLRNLLEGRSKVHFDNDRT